MMINISDIALVVLLAADAGGGGAGGGRGPSDFSFLFPLVAVGFLFYLMMIRPERRKRAEMTKLLDNLKKNDRVVTIGGIYGTVVNVQKGSEDLTIKVDEGTNTKLRILRSSVSRIITSEDSEAKKTTA